MELKDIIHGQLDWFKNPILNPNAFEEGNMVNIFPTIKVNISTKPRVQESILLGVQCTPKEVANYIDLFKEF